jgi:hypothetical protein
VMHAPSLQVYRLITRRTYESVMFERASLKLGLEQAVLCQARDKGPSTVSTACSIAFLHGYVRPSVCVSFCADVCVNVRKWGLLMCLLCTYSVTSVQVFLSCISVSVHVEACDRASATYDIYRSRRCRPVNACSVVD